MKEIICILLKTQQMVLCETDFETEYSVDERNIYCEKPLLVNWAHREGTIVMGLSSYPMFITHVIRRAGEIILPMPRSDVLRVYPQKEIKDEVIASYKERSVAVYGNITVVHSMPSLLKGRA